MHRERKHVAQSSVPGCGHRGGAWPGQNKIHAGKHAPHQHTGNSHRQRAPEDAVTTPNANTRIRTRARTHSAKPNQTSGNLGDGDHVTGCTPEACAKHSPSARGRERLDRASVAARAGRETGAETMGSSWPQAQRAFGGRMRAQRLPWGFRPLPAPLPPGHSPALTCSWGLLGPALAAPRPSRPAACFPATWRPSRMPLPPPLVIPGL